MLLTVIGIKTYETLRSLLAPERPRGKTYDQLVSVLQKHYDPKPLVIGERFRFYQRSQKAGESTAEFIADLRRLSIRCEFGDFLDQALRDRFVCGVRSEALQKKLLTEAELTIKRAQEIAQSMESADLSSKDLKPCCYSFLIQGKNTCENILQSVLQLGLLQKGAHISLVYCVRRPTDCILPGP